MRDDAPQVNVNPFESIMVVSTYQLVFHEHHMNHAKRARGLRSFTNSNVKDLIKYCDNHPKAMKPLKKEPCYTQIHRAESENGKRKVALPWE